MSMFRVKRFRWLSLLAVLIMVLVSVVPAAADNPPAPMPPSNISDQLIVGMVANPGVDSITYSIQADNTTYSTFTGLQISGIIPDGSNLLACWAENPGQNTCDVKGNQVVWYLSKLMPDYQKTSVYVFSVSAPASGIVNSRATVTWSGGMNAPWNNTGHSVMSPVIKTKMPADKPAAAAGQVPAPLLSVPGIINPIAVGIDVAVDKGGHYATFALRSTANVANTIVWGQQPVYIPSIHKTVSIPVSGVLTAKIPNGLQVLDCGWGFEGTTHGAPGQFCGISPDGQYVYFKRVALVNDYFTVAWDGVTPLTSQAVWTWGTQTGGAGMLGGGDLPKVGLPDQNGQITNALYSAPVTASAALLKQTPSANFCPAWAVGGACAPRDASSDVVTVKPFDATAVTKWDNGMPRWAGLTIGYGSYLPTTFGLTANVSADKSMVTYAMRYVSGTSDLAGVKIFAPIPGGATLVSSGIDSLGNQPGVIDEFGNISWNLGDLKPYTSTPLFVWTVQTNGLPSLAEKGYLTFVGGIGNPGGKKGVTGVNTSGVSPNGRIQFQAPIPANIGPGTWLNESETAEVDTNLQ